MCIRDSGREALEIFAREAPQVAVLDIEMPGLTGLEVARKIRETDRNCAIQMCIRDSPNSV